MRGAFVIAGKDLRNFFLSPLFYVVAGTCSLVWWLFYAFPLRQFVHDSAISAMQNGEGVPIHFAVVYPFVSGLNLIMILAVAAVTMRLFTDEKRNRTFDLLLTAPVTSSEIVLGKLIAGIVTAWVLVFIAALYPMSLMLYGALDWGPMLSSFAGLALLTAGYVAVGMFASSLTANAVVAIILALIMQMSLWFIGMIAEAAADPSSKSVIEHLSVGEHFTDFMKGNPGVAAVVYFISLVFLFAFLTRQVVESARWR